MLALVFAGSGSAAAPAGNACQTGGQVNGEGATLQNTAQELWIQGYTSDVCGNVGPGTGLPGEATTPNNTAVTYNGTNNTGQGQYALHGSGAGQEYISCRAGLFAGSDIPYDQATLTKFDSAPGTVNGNSWFPGAATTCTNGGPQTPPDDWSGFQNPFFGSAGGYPFIATSGGTQNQALSDQTANIMSFPVISTAVAVGLYFGAPGTNSHGCPTATTAQLTGSQLSGLMDGQITTWNDPALGSAFAGCFSGANGSTPLQVTRTVRSDKSGTTQNFKNYLASPNTWNSDTCSSATSNKLPWTTLALDANNQLWPQGGSCSPLTTGSGNSGVLAQCVVTPGTICYADLPDFEAFQATHSTLLPAQLPAAVGGAFQKPFSSHTANCDVSGVPTPGPSNNGAVGLDPSDNWALDQSPANGNMAFKGGAYPICALTWDLVYVGTSNSDQTSGSTNPFMNTSVNNNMRRTLYSYILYILTSGQAKAAAPESNYYLQLPSGLLGSEIAGFKANY